MQKLRVIVISEKKASVNAMGCGKHWLNLCGAKQG